MLDPLVYTMPECCELLLCSARKIRSLVDEGRLRITTRNPYRVTRQSVERFLADSAGPTPAPVAPVVPFPVPQPAVARAPRFTRRLEISDLVERQRAGTR